MSATGSRLLRFKKLQSALSDRLTAQAMQMQGEVLFLRPADADQLATTLRVTREHGLKLGDEVVIGVEAFDTVQLVDPHSCICEVGAQVPLQVLEARLKTSGLTLGPLTPAVGKLRVGQWLEGTHASLRPIPGGRLEPAALSLEAALWSGQVYRSHRSPRSASGPDLDHLLLGGHGAVGRVTRATLRIAPRPTTAEVRTVSVPHGAAAVTLLQQCLAVEAVPVWARVAPSSAGLTLSLRFEGLAFRVHRDAARAVKLALASGLVEHLNEEHAEVHAAREVEVVWPSLAAVLGEPGAPVELHRIARESVVCVSARPIDGPGTADLSRPPTSSPRGWPALADSARGAP